MALDGNFEDVESSTQFYYYSHAHAVAIRPTHGPKEGKTKVRVWGNHFVDFGEDTTCSFGVKSVKARRIDEGLIECEAPSSDVVGKPMPFAVSLNGQ